MRPSLLWQKSGASSSRTHSLRRYSAGADSALPSVDELEGQTGGKEMATVSEARLGKWFEEVRAEHVALGMEQGIQRGLARQREQLRHQAEARFDAWTAERLSESLRREDSQPRLDAIAEAIVRCETGAELLREVRGASLGGA